MPLRTPQDVLEVLTATPVRLAAVSGAVDRRPSADEWSAAEVLAHLRACGEVWGGCVRRLLAEDRPTIRALNPRTFHARTDWATRDWAEHLTAFTAERGSLLELLRDLAPAGWERSALVTGAGRPVERTVLTYAEWIASHERPHVKQVERAVAGAV